MSKAFQAKVCKNLAHDLSSRDYKAHGCHFTKEVDALVATVWLVEGVSHLEGHFMPRLSIGIQALRPDIAVLSRDLHQLVEPAAATTWYAWNDASATDIERARRDLVQIGLPWLDQQLDPQKLVESLEYERDRPRPEAQEKPWWHPRPTKDRQTSPPLRLNVLQFLSYAYEVQGRYQAALETWEKYIAGHTALQKGSPLEQGLAERLLALKAKVDCSL